jgi:hypothetical protein
MFRPGTGDDDKVGSKGPVNHEGFPKSAGDRPGAIDLVTVAIPQLELAVLMPPAFRKLSADPEMTAAACICGPREDGNRQEER